MSEVQAAAAETAAGGASPLAVDALLPARKEQQTGSGTEAAPEAPPPQPPQQQPQPQPQDAEAGPSAQDAAGAAAAAPDAAGQPGSPPDEQPDVAADPAAAAAAAAAAATAYGASLQHESPAGEPPEQLGAATGPKDDPSRHEAPDGRRLSQLSAAEAQQVLAGQPQHRKGQPSLWLRALRQAAGLTRYKTQDDGGHGGGGASLTGAAPAAAAEAAEADAAKARSPNSPEAAAARERLPLKGRARAAPKRFRPGASSRTTEQQRPALRERHSRGANGAAAGSAADESDVDASEARKATATGAPAAAPEPGQQKRRKPPPEPSQQYAPDGRRLSELTRKEAAALLQVWRCPVVSTVLKLPNDWTIKATICEMVHRPCRCSMWKGAVCRSHAPAAASPGLPLQVDTVVCFLLAFAWSPEGPYTSLNPKTLSPFHGQCMHLLWCGWGAAVFPTLADKRLP